MFENEHFIFYLKYLYNCLSDR